MWNLIMTKDQLRALTIMMISYLQDCFESFESLPFTVFKMIFLQICEVAAIQECVDGL